MHDEQAAAGRKSEPVETEIPVQGGDDERRGPPANLFSAQCSRHILQKFCRSICVLAV